MEPKRKGCSFLFIFWCVYWIGFYGPQAGRQHLLFDWMERGEREKEKRETMDGINRFDRVHYPLPTRCGRCSYRWMDRTYRSKADSTFRCYNYVR